MSWITKPMCSLLFILFYLHNQFQSPIINTVTKKTSNTFKQEYHLKKKHMKIKELFTNCATVLWTCDIL